MTSIKQILFPVAHRLEWFSEENIRWKIYSPFKYMEIIDCLTKDLKKVSIDDQAFKEISNLLHLIHQLKGKDHSRLFYWPEDVDENAITEEIGGSVIIESVPRPITEKWKKDTINKAINTELENYQLFLESLRKYFDETQQNKNVVPIMVKSFTYRYYHEQESVLLLLMNSLIDSFLHRDTKQEDFIAVFSGTNVPQNQIIWIGKKNSLRYLFVLLKDFVANVDPIGDSIRLCFKLQKGDLHNVEGAHPPGLRVRNKLKECLEPFIRRNIILKKTQA